MITKTKYLNAGVVQMRDEGKPPSHLVWALISRPSYVGGVVYLWQDLEIGIHIPSFRFTGGPQRQTPTFRPVSVETNVTKIT